MNIISKKKKNYKLKYKLWKDFYIILLQVRGFHIFNIKYILILKKN